MYPLLQMLIVSQLAAFGLGLQCFDCSFNTISASSSSADWLLQQLNKIKNEKCQLLRPEDQDDLNIINCPKPRVGYSNKCGKIDGTVTTNILGKFSIQVNLVSRGCVEVPDDDSEYTDGCHPDLPANSKARELIDKAFNKTELGEVEWSGQACYDSKRHDKISDPVCPRCSWTKLTVDSSAIQTLVDTFDGIRDDSCKFESSDDYYEVNYRSCPQAPTGQMSKCGKINGQISGRTLSVDWTVNSVQRDCVTGPTGDEEFMSETEHAVTRSRPNQIFAPLVAESLDAAKSFLPDSFANAFADDADDTNFAGTVQYLRSAEIDPNTGVSQFVSSTYLLLLCIIMAFV